MRKSLIVAAGVLLAACGNNNPTPANDSAAAKKDSSAAVQPIQSPYPIAYSSSFTIDDPKNAESVLQLWKSYQDGNPGASKDLLADSMTVVSAKGMTIHGTRDSVVGIVQKERDMAKSVTDVVNAIVALKSDKGDHWVLIWGSEKWVDKKGKADSVGIHQAWRFNDKGQADMMLGYEQQPEKAMGKMPAKK